MNTFYVRSVYQSEEGASPLLVDLPWPSRNICSCASLAGEADEQLDDVCSSHAGIGRQAGKLSDTEKKQKLLRISFGIIFLDDMVCMDLIRSE